MAGAFGSDLVIIGDPSGQALAHEPRPPPTAAFGRGVMVDIHVLRHIAEVKLVI
jgi:hypothetical protein